jgi:PhnB protein
MPESQKVTAYLCVDGATRAIQWYAQVFGAVEDPGQRYANEDGSVGHAEFTIGNVRLYVSDEWPEGGVFSPKRSDGRSVGFVIEVEDADTVFERAVAAGAMVDRPLHDEFYGRGGWIIDPFGHHWSILMPARA